jgi:hypothetical protein
VLNKKIVVTLFIVSHILFLSANHVSAMADHSKTDKAEITQDLTPPKQINMYLDGFHCIKTEMNFPKEKQRQIHAAHYCAHHDNVFMCSVYDGTGAEARLVAVEYVINSDTYQKLSKAEKKYWHPHNGEVDTGLLRMPGLDSTKEKATLSFLRSTWGKTWQVWPDLSNDLPIGKPVLLWSIDADKINASTKRIVAQRDTKKF